MASFVEMAEGFEPEFQVAEKSLDNPAKILVVGVGGGGNNSLERMIEAELQNVQYIALNTDAQVISRSSAPIRLTIGMNTTNGLGAGGNPENGREAAKEDKDKIRSLITGADMVFMTGGMGGGTGSGALPVVAEIVKEEGILGVAIVTKPFDFEGNKRKANAEKAISELQEIVDTLIVIPNQRLLSVVKQSTHLLEAFKLADEMLHQGVRIVSDLITIPGVINLDLSDVRTVIKGVGGDALIGIGEVNEADAQAEGEERAVLAARAAIRNPMLEDVSIEGAKGVLLNITGANVSLYDVHTVGDIISKSVGEDANLIVGTCIDPDMGDNLRVGVIAAGFQRNQQRRIISQSFESVKNKTKKDTGYLDIFAGEVDIPTPSKPKPKPQKAETFELEQADEELFIKPDPVIDETPIQEPEQEVVQEFDPGDYDLPPWLRKKNKG